MSYADENDAKYDNDEKGEDRVVKCQHLQTDILQLWAIIRCVNTMMKPEVVQHLSVIWARRRHKGCQKHALNMIF